MKNNLNDLNKVKILPVSDRTIVPKKASDNAVGYDLHAFMSDGESIVIDPKETVPVSVGFRMELPSNIEAQIRTRSGLSLKGIVVSNSPGTIDPDYRGEVKVIIYNRNSCSVQINDGDRIAQMVFHEVPEITLMVVGALSPTERGEKGFGSTGV